MVLKLADTLQNELALNLQTQSSIHPGKGLIEDKNTFCQGPDQEGRVIFVLTRGTRIDTACPHPDMASPEDHRVLCICALQLNMFVC